MRRIGITLVTIAALLFVVPGMASAIQPQRSEPSCGMKVLDAVLVRPLSAVSMVGATVLGLVAMPFAAPFGVAREIGDDVIGGAYRFAIRRPLGDFSD